MTLPPYRIIENLEAENRRLKRDKERLEWVLKHCDITFTPEPHLVFEMKKRRHVDFSMRREKK